VPKVAVLISGRGSNLLALLRTAEAEGWDVQWVVISNRADAPGLRLARDRGVRCRVATSAGLDRDAYDRVLSEALQEEAPDWIALAGFLRLLGPHTLARFPGRVLNIHPSLLPALPGLHTHQRALEAGHTAHGCTVHLVDLGLDTGAILAQERVPVLPDDDEDRLAARVLEAEHRLYPAVVRSAILGRLARDFPPRAQEPQP
jgi:formyltetrahydrofolate-dependent phosphoribosylglycinamide formyltransferase